MRSDSNNILYRIQMVDNNLSKKLQLKDTQIRLKRMFSFISHSGDAIYILIILGIVFAFADAGWQLRIVLIFVVDLLTALIVQTMKFIFRRRRPEGEWGQVYRKHDPHSFPSGHSARGGAMGMIAILMGPIGFGLIMGIWGVSVATSRVLMAVHYFSDVLIGFALGCCISLLLYFMIF